MGLFSTFYEYSQAPCLSSALGRRCRVCYNINMSSVAVILNPAAGGGRSGRRRRRLETDLQRSGLDWELVVTRNKADMRSRIQACADTAAWLLIVGGDTSFRIAASEILDRHHEKKTIPRLAFFGAGSANDLTRGLGIRNLRHLCGLIRQNQVRQMDVGWVRTESPPREHCFLGSMSLGLGVLVNREMARTRGESGRPLAAWIPGAVALRRVFNSHDLPMDLSVNGRPVTCSLAVVLNGPYYAGGLRLAPEASPFDHKLDLVLLSTRGWLSTLVAGVAVLVRRRLKAETGSDWNLKSKETFSVQLDGDVFPAGRACTVGLHAAALSVAAGTE